MNRVVLQVMGMSFGDWELFRMMVLALRDPTSDWSIRFAGQQKSTPEEEQHPTTCGQEAIVDPPVVKGESADISRRSRGAHRPR